MAKFRENGVKYYEPTINVFPEGVCKNFHPILTPDQRELRVLRLARAVADVYLAVEERNRGIDVPSGARLSDGMSIAINYNVSQDDNYYDEPDD